MIWTWLGERRDLFLLSPPQERRSMLSELGSRLIDWKPIKRNPTIFELITDHCCVYIIKLNYYYTVECRLGGCRWITYYLTMNIIFIMFMYLWWRQRSVHSIKMTRHGCVFTVTAAITVYTNLYRHVRDVHRVFLSGSKYNNMSNL